MLSSRSGKKRAVPKAAPGNILNTTQAPSSKRLCCDPELEPETDPEITLASDPSIIPFRLLAPLVCPGWMALMHPDKADGPCAIKAAAFADPAKKCDPRMRCCALLFKCRTCRYGPTRPHHWTLDQRAQEGVFGSLQHHTGADIMQEMMGSMGSEVSHLSIEYRGGFKSAVLGRLVCSLDGLMRELRSFLNKIDARTLADLVWVHRAKIYQGSEVLELVTDIVWDLITKSDPGQAIMPTLEYVPRIIRCSGEPHSDWQQLESALRALALEGYDASVKERGQSLMMALNAWSAAQGALKAQCAFTAVCEDFIHTLSYKKFVALKESYHIQWGRVIRTQVKTFDY
jgi:hypothetical protein